MSTIKVGGIVITPPSYKASGGVSAALSLMEKVSQITPTCMMVMGDSTASFSHANLNVDTVKATNIGSNFSFCVPSRLNTLLWRSDFGSWLDTHRPDIVHLHNPHPPGAMLLAARSCIVRKIPYVFSTHGFVEYDNFSKAYGAPFWQKPIIDKFIRQPLVEVARNSSRILMLSPFEKSIFESMGINNTKLDVVSNGIDCSMLDVPSDEEKLIVFKKYKLNANKPIVFFVGNHTRNKGIDVLLKAYKMLKTDAQLVVGGGLRSDAEHEFMLREANISPESGKVIFTDFLDQSDLKTLYHICDIFAFPSRADTLPLVVLEAMAAKKPVVSTEIGGIPYQVTEQNGILVKPGNANSLSDALEKLLTNPILGKKMGLVGVERAKTLFSWSKSAKRSLEIYQNVLAEG